MYQIIKDGVSIGLTENLNYIQKAENGCFVLCPERDALGIVFEGTVYHLAGRDSLPGCETIGVELVDAGLQLSAAQASLDDADELSVDHEYRLSMLELGFTEGGEG